MKKIPCTHVMSHGQCWLCGFRCGCSFDPTSLNDYCDTHRPKIKPSPGYVDRGWRTHSDGEWKGTGHK